MAVCRGSISNASFNRMALHSSIVVHFLHEYCKSWSLCDTRILWQSYCRYFMKVNWKIGLSWTLLWCMFQKSVGIYRMSGMCINVPFDNEQLISLCCSGWVVCWLHHGRADDRKAVVSRKWSYPWTVVCSLHLRRDVLSSQLESHGI